MRLKKIELKGFKSFGQPTSLIFSENVTGVVGPNGSGKSNIVDAFRWVLGEHKTTGLRLDKMSDVLFNGSKSRKPANACSVNLIFENDKGILPSEYREVEISRHLYRNGNSEYRLNGVACRLKDIVSLLADTGIASNSYAIIALDMVDDILQDNDHARRRMFEQAAGISKFKKRKKEVENKLRSSEMDLERVQDLLFEIEQNLGQLEKQAKRAKSYHRLRKRYREMSILLGKLRIRDLMDGNKNIKEALRKKEMELAAQQANRAKLEAELQTSKQANLKDEERLNSSQKEVAAIVNELRKLESDRDLDVQALRNLEISKKTREDKIEELGRQLEQVGNRMEYLEKSMAAEREVESQLQKALDELGEEKKAVDRHADALTGEHEALKGQIQKLQSDRNERDKKAVVCQNKLESISGEIERIEEEDQLERKRNSDLDEKLKSLSDQFARLQTELDAALAREKDRKMKLDELKTQREKLEEEIKLMEREMDARKNERALLKSMLDKLEGYPDSIKFLNNRREWSKYAALLTDLIYCSDEYRPAIEAVLEPWLDHYVVPGWDVAREGLNMLRDAQKGKAQFLLQDSFRDQKADRKEMEGLTAAVDVVQIDEEYLPLFRHLLGDVWIVEQGDFPEKMPYDSAVLVSKKGDIVRRNSTVEGGSSDLFTGKKIGRKKALELLENKIAKSEKLLEEKLAVLRQLRMDTSALEHENFQKEIKSLEAESAQIKTREAGISATKTTTAETFERRKLRLNALKKERFVVQEELEEAQKEKNFMDGELEKLLEVSGKSSSRVQTAVEQKTRQSEKFNRAQIECIQQQNKVSGFEKELEFQRGRKEEYGSEKKLLLERVKEDGEQMKKLNHRLEGYKTSLESAYEKKRELESVLDGREQSYFTARNAIFEMEKSLSEVNREFEQLNSVIEQYKEKDRETDWQVKAITERLSVEFDLDLESGGDIELSPEELDEMPLELEKKVDRLKSRLNNFGEVNPLALEAFEEMKLRYEEISGQKKDIEEARDSLRETILEIETTAKTRFLEAFEQIRFNFIHVFRSLFTEDDNCDLMLSDMENPLESEVEIIAKPKGKRPQSISQLSGGEKTLTAISLLFALYLLKPAPFCIFDEVDAPLDDSNIEKFNRIIKEFSKDSQFIIVTHNKQTMTHLDIIYGVYMEVSGVSGVSAVDFRALKNEDFLTELTG